MRLACKKARFEERLSSLEADLVAARKLAVESTDKADALELANKSLAKEMENRKVSSAASSAEVGQGRSCRLAS